MTANGKIRITINTNYTDGEFFHFTDDFLHQQRVVMAHAVACTFENSRSSVLELRIVVASESAEELLAAMVRGETELSIGKMSAAVEPN